MKMSLWISLHSNLSTSDVGSVQLCILAGSVFIVPSPVLHELYNIELGFT